MKAKSHIYTGTVEGYNSEGAGVVRLAGIEEEPARGRAVFVPGAVRGEEIDFALRHLTKTAAWGELIRIRTDAPSPRRRAPDCPCFGQCGGCVFRHLTYEEELWAKRQRVQDALRRLGGSGVEVEEVLGAADPLRYRNKAQYPVSADGRIGFYRAGSHQVVSVPDCLIQPDAACRTAAAVQNWLRRYGVSGYEEHTGRGLVRHVYVRTNSAGESVCCIVANGKRLPKEPELVGLVRDAAPRTVGVALNVNTKPGNRILGSRFRILWGRDTLTETMGGLCFRLSLPSFFQVNRAQAERLYGKALEYAALTGTETALDLYCGIGTITLCLAGQARRVIGAEVTEQAVKDAEQNAERNGIRNAEFVCADASETARRFAEAGLRPDVITLDPPRKGLTPEGIAAVAAMQPERVVYVSCDPGTLGRDVKRFGALGYRAVRAAAVDLFPGTQHVETVVLMTRIGDDSTD